MEGSREPTSRRTRVVFPAPDGPTIPQYVTGSKLKRGLPNDWQTQARRHIGHLVELDPAHRPRQKPCAPRRPARGRGARRGRPYAVRAPTKARHAEINCSTGARPRASTIAAATMLPADISLPRTRYPPTPSIDACRQSRMNFAVAPMPPGRVARHRLLIEAAVGRLAPAPRQRRQHAHGGNGVGVADRGVGRIQRPHCRFVGLHQFLAGHPVC